MTEKKARVAWIVLVWFVAMLFGGYVLARGLEEASWLAAIVALLITLWMLRPQSPPVAIGGQLEAASNYLAEQSLEFWQFETAARGLQDTPALTMRWEPASARLFDRSLAAMATVGSATQPTEFVAAYRKLPTGRLVLLGDQSGGKTGWATQLTLGLLTERAPDEPVAVLMPLSSASGSWKPTEEHLFGWLARRLTDDFPGLANTKAYGDDAAKRLLMSGRVIPILDGLDELPFDDQSAAITALNQQLPVTTPLVITCRTGAYRKLATEVVLQAAVAIKIQALSVEDITDFLSPRNGTGAWQPVFDRLNRNPQCSLAMALSTPLMAFLARIVYKSGSSNPSELLDARRFPSRRAVEDYLLGAFVPAAFALSNVPRVVPAPYSQWNPERATRWLSFLARDMCGRNSTQLAWWDIRRVLSPGQIARYVGAVQGVVSAPIYAFWYYGTDEHSRSMPSDVGIPGFVIASSIQAASIVPAMWLMLKYDLNKNPKHMTSIWRLRRWAMRLRGAPAGLAISMSVFVGIAVGILLGLVEGILAATTSLFGAVLTQGLSEPAATSRATSPRQLFRSDRATALMGGFLVSILGALGIAYSIGPYSAVLGFVPLFYAYCMADILGRTVWGPFVVTRIILATGGKAPLRLLRFLEDSHKLGLLRQVGGIYQFRHSRLQKHLGASSADPCLNERRYCAE